MVMTELQHNKAIVALQPKVLIELCKARKDPRSHQSKKRSKEFRPYHRQGEVGKMVVAKLLWLTREIVMNCSQEVFAKLLVEDLKRELILAGTSIDEIEAQNIHLSNVTIKNIEDAAGTDGLKLKTIRYVARRLYNPCSKKAFTPIELQELMQDELVGFNLRPEDMEQFLNEIDAFNEKRDRELYYIF